MRGTPEGREAADASACIVVELFGMPRLLAGEREVALTWQPDLRLGAVPARLVAACPALDGKVTDAAGALASGLVFNLNGRDFLRDPAAPLRPGDRLLLLSADPGG